LHEKLGGHPSKKNRNGEKKKKFGKKPEMEGGVPKAKTPKGV